MQSPVAFAPALDAYLNSLSTDEIRALVLRSIKHLDAPHRAQLALFLGLDIAADPIDEVGNSTAREAELREFIASCGLLRERFGAFLRDNPRAIDSLGKSASEHVFGRRPSRFPNALARIPLKAYGLLAVIVLFTIVPLAAQYAHQRGMLAGLSDIAIAPVISAPPAKRSSAPRRAAVPPPVRTTRTHSHGRQTRMVSRRSVRVAALPAAVHRTAFRRRPARRHRAVARVWKFDPRYNPYFNSKRWQMVRRRIALRSIALPAARAPQSRFEQRARLMVHSYLKALIAGNTSAALQHLGLPRTASLQNLSEAPFLSRDARAHVVSTETQSDGRARVEVDILSSNGEYFETFYVARDGPAMRIMDRFYVPVNRTAEERAAKLLAKDWHS